MTKPVNSLLSRPLFSSFLPMRGTRVGLSRSSTLAFPRTSFRSHTHFNDHRRCFSKLVPNPRDSTLKKTEGIGLYLLLGGVLLASVGLYAEKARITQQPPATASSDDFAKISVPITERILPLVEHYRTGRMIIRPVVAIAGCSGVGKSHFAHQLLVDLQKKGINAKILHFDDFIDPGPFEGAREDIHPNFDHRTAHAFLKKVADDEPIIEKLTWDLTGPKPVKVKENYDLRSVELLIFEGEFTLCDETTYDFVNLSNVRIAVDAADKDIINWDWKRARDLETSDFAAFAELRTKSLSKYRRLAEPLIKQYADFILTKEKNHRYHLQRLT